MGDFLNNNNMLGLVVILYIVGVGRRQHAPTNPASINNAHTLTITNITNIIMLLFCMCFLRLVIGFEIVIFVWSSLR